MPKALVTGGAGFIGSHVVDRFVGAGYQVAVIDDLSTGKRENLGTGVALHTVDVGSPATAALIRDGSFDVIAHLAAQIDVRKSVEDPVADAKTNVLGALNILESVRALSPETRPRVIFASTGGALYGDAATFPTPETAPTNPDAPYGITKLATEFYLAYYGRIWGLEHVVLRFGNVYGPRQNPHGDAGVIAIFSRRFIDGKPVTIYGDGTQTRDYVYVGDVADAFFAAANTNAPVAGPIESRAFNVGTGVETSVLELAETLREVVGGQPAIQHAPARAGEIARSLLDPRKAEATFQWRAKVELRDGLRRTVEWMNGVGA